MDYLLTVAPTEWDSDTRRRWRPVEEAKAMVDDGFRAAAGLLMSPVLIFVCRRCEHWPIGFRII
jgi:hypothetical protein